MLTRPTALSVFAAGLGCVAASQLLMKWRLTSLAVPEGSLPGLLGAALRDPWIWLAGALVVCGAVSWYLAMTRLPLGFMLPTAAIVSPVVALGAAALLGEPMSSQKLAAILVITAGVAWLGVQG